jgi:hypothetical protein
MLSIESADTPSRATISAAWSRISDCRASGAKRTRFGGRGFCFTRGGGFEVLLA